MVGEDEVDQRTGEVNNVFHCKTQINANIDTIVCLKDYYLGCLGLVVDEDDADMNKDKVSICRYKTQIKANTDANVCLNLLPKDCYLIGLRLVFDEDTVDWRKDNFNLCYCESNEVQVYQNQIRCIRSVKKQLNVYHLSFFPISS